MPTSYNRDHWGMVREALQFLKDQQQLGKEKASQTRLQYGCRATSEQIQYLIGELEHHELIKFYSEEYSTSAGMRRAIIITKKGLKLLKLLDAQAALLSKSPWILEASQY